LSRNEKVFQPDDLKYEQSDLIGKGGFADVFKAVVYQKEQGMIVAVKKPSVRTPFSDSEMYELRRETAILLAIPPHNNVIRLIGYCNHPYHYAIVLEYIDGGDLHHLLCSKYNRDTYLDDWRKRLDMAHQIADGMKHLHSLNPPVIHRDLKPKNILIRKSLPNYVCKISDFGLSKIRYTSSARTTKQSNTTAHPGGTVAYIAPERYGAQDRDTPPPMMAMADVYSFGVILWQFREFREPFDGQLHLLNY
jgi:serine/threonine protein kinase